MEELMGAIKLFAGNFAPQGYLLCNGALLQINQYQALFSILNVTYGGDGVTTFALPDLRSRIPVGAGQAKGLSNYQLGQQTGAENQTLDQTNIPTLGGTVYLNSVTGTAIGNVNTSSTASIGIPCNNAGGGSADPTNNFIAGDGTSQLFASAPTGTLKPFKVTLPINFAVSLPVTLNPGTATVVVNQNRGATPVNAVQPVLGMNYIICTEGLYPSKP